MSQFQPCHKFDLERRKIRRWMDFVTLAWLWVFLTRNLMTKLEKIEIETKKSNKLTKIDGILCLKILKMLQNILKLIQMRLNNQKCIAHVYNSHFVCTFHSRLWILFKKHQQKPWDYFFSSIYKQKREISRSLFRKKFFHIFFIIKRCKHCAMCIENEVIKI